MSELDAVGDVEHAVEDAETRVAYVVDGGIGADAKAGRDMTSRRRLELLATDAGVDQSVDFRSFQPDRFKGLPCRLDGAMSQRITRFPPAPLGDAGESFELALGNPQRLIHRPQPSFQLRRSDDDRRQLVTDGIDVDPRVIHSAILRARSEKSVS